MTTETIREPMHDVQEVYYNQRFKATFKKRPLRCLGCDTLKVRHPIWDQSSLVGFLCNRCNKHYEYIQTEKQMKKLKAYHNRKMAQKSYKRSISFHVNMMVDKYEQLVREKSEKKP